MDDKDAAPDEIVIPLRKPLVFAEQTYSELRLREPTGAQWAEWDMLTGVAANMKALSIITGIPEQAIKQIGTRDLSKAFKALDDFFE